MSKQENNGRGPLHSIDWPFILDGMERDNTLKVWLKRVRHQNEGGESYPGTYEIAKKTGLWIDTVIREDEELERLGKMKKQRTELTDNGNSLDIYLMYGVAVQGSEWEKQQGLIGALFPILNMVRDKDFETRPWLTAWYETSKEIRQKRYAKKQALIALGWMLACTEQIGLTWNIAPPNISKHKSLHKLLQEKLGINWRQAARYVATFLDSGIIEFVDNDEIGNGGGPIKRYRFTKRFIYDWLRLPEKNDLGELEEHLADI